MLSFRTLSFACALLSAPLLVAQQDSCTATVATVHEHVGQIITICGTPSQVSAPAKVKGDPVYLNFGGTYPNHTFTVIIWDDVHKGKREKLVKRYTDKSLRIKGWVKTRDGKPEITVKTLEDIEVE